MEIKNTTSELNLNVSKYLQEYVKMSNPQYATMLKGSWGCGKTFFIKNELEKWNKEGSDINAFYVSVYGLNSIKQLTQKLKEEISPFWHSKGMKIARKIGSGILKSAIKVDLNSKDEGVDENAFTLHSELDLLSIFKNDDGSIKGEKVFVFDDLERSEIPLNQLFGFINEFVEHHKCKVILVSDEDKLEELNSSERKEIKVDSPYKLKYKNFKEKLVGQTLSIEADYLNATSIFIEEKTDKQQAYFEKNKELILKIFVASKTDNLRLLRQFFSDFERFIDPIENEFNEYERYDIIKLSILIHYLINYLEFKDGNKEIVEWGTNSISFELYFQKNKSDDKEESEADSKYKIFEDKYSQFIDDRSAIQNIKILDYEIFAEHLKKGYVNYDLIIEKIKNNSLLNTSEKKDWEKLYRWRLLDNNEFSKLLDLEYKRFINHEINDILVLTHLYFIFLTLNNLNIMIKPVKLDDIFLKNIERIIKLKDEPIPLITNDGYGLPYQNRDLSDREAIGEIIKKANEFISNHQHKYINKSISNIVENLGDGDIDKMIDDLQTKHSFGYNVYWLNNIFSNADMDKVTEKFASLEPINQYNFINMLKNKRYRNGEFIDDEREFIDDFKAKLKEKAKETELVEKERYETYVEILNEILKIKVSNS
ncbi:KAP family NTPase [Psychroflexus sp. CAK57W]|uniref:P-loop NTPase fold protein n=1 Tax=Psychroflexus curvus TaxID=2873595 RepID=UPI001CCBC3A4|nr:P-loop NTPase fold protein [Psychroflexus curvus]MBZ9788208.1 KAP family NTPase [Psychroflexus curvus]